MLHADDRLSFVGVVESVVELQQMQGLVPDTDQIHKLDTIRHNRKLIEAVVSEASPLVRKTVREGAFRTTYNAVIIAVHRAGERLKGKIGDIILQPGDTLLLEGPTGFAEQHRNSSAFYLVSELDSPATLRWTRAWIAMLILLGLIVAIAIRPDQVMTAALCAAMAMIVTRCCTGTLARQAIDWQVLIVIGSAFGIAEGDGFHAPRLHHRRRRARLDQFDGDLRHARGRVPDHRAAHQRDDQQRRGGAGVPHRLPVRG
jgi:hypothetical protein